MLSLSDRTANYRARRRQVGRIGYRGVRWLPSRKRFVAFLPSGVLGKTGHPIAQFDDAATAALCRDRVLLHYAARGDPRLNFPDRKLAPMTLEAARRAARLQWKNSHHTNSRYRGVNKARQKGFWTAALWDGDGASHFLGTWATEKAAAQAYDRGARYYGLPAEYLNFPREKLPLPPANNWRTKPSRSPRRNA